MSHPHQSAVPAAADAPLVPAVVRAVALLDTLARQRQPMSPSQLASALALPRSSVHGLCNTLLALGLLRRQADGALGIGPRVMGLAEAFVTSTDVAREFNVLWQSLPQPPDETVVLSVLDGNEVLYLAVRNGARPMGLAFSVGMRLPAHVAATGKALLSCLPPAQALARLGTGALSRLTERSMTDRQQLKRELAITRERGYGIDDEGVRLGVYCFAAPVFDASGAPVAALGLCLNKAQLVDGDAPQARAVMLALARSLTQRLGGALPDPVSLTQHRPARQRS